jgi:hypothetical protein
VKRSTPLTEKPLDDDVRRRLRNRVRAVRLSLANSNVRRPSEEAVHGRIGNGDRAVWFHDLLELWQSPSIQEVLAGWTFSEENREMAVWQSAPMQNAVAHLPAKEKELALKAALIQSKGIRDLVRRQHAKKTASKRHENRLDRDRWVREQYGLRRKRDLGYSVPQFRLDLLGSLKAIRLGREPVIFIPKDIAKVLMYNRKLISVARLQQIINSADFADPEIY